MIDISVIVPIFNIDKYLRECLESITMQSCPNMEIILIDDGSSDLSGVICDEYARRDSRIIVIHKKNGGLVSARKEGLKHAHGMYILYVDGDDWLEPESCSQMVRYIDDEKVDMVFFDHFENTGNYQKLVSHSIKEGVYSKNQMRELIYPYMIVGESFFEWQVFPSMWDVIMRRELLVKHQYSVDDGITMGEDAACIYPCLLDAESVSFKRKAYYHYRQTPNSMIKQMPDLIEERKRMALLYRCGNEQISKYATECDVKKQWIAYMLFLMIPRSDQLYKNYSKLTYLYPYYEVKKDMKIAIYGAGTYGQRIFSYLKQTNFCEVVVWFDCNYEELNRQGFDVKNPEDIDKYQYEGIIIANMFYRSRQQIKNFINKKVNTKIFEIEENFIFSEESLMGFGL